MNSDRKSVLAAIRNPNEATNELEDLLCRYTAMCRFVR